MKRGVDVAKRRASVGQTGEVVPEQGKKQGTRARVERAPGGAAGADGAVAEIVPAGVKVEARAIAAPQAMRATGPTALMTRMEVAEDAALAVRDPGFYGDDVHELRSKMRREQTISDWDWEIALLRRAIERVERDIGGLAACVEYVSEYRGDRERMGEIRELPRDDAEAARLVSGWLRQLERGRDSLERTLTTRLSSLATMIDKRSLKQQRERYLLEGELIHGWSEKIDGLLADVVERAMDEMRKHRPGANAAINAWGATVFEFVGARIAAIPREVAEEIRRSRSATSSPGSEGSREKGAGEVHGDDQGGAG